MNYYKDICNLINNHGNIKMPRLSEAVKFLKISPAKISALGKKLFEESSDFHDARFDTTATYLLVTEGIKKGYIEKNYFSKIVEKVG